MSDQKPMTVDEAVDLYPEQWILMRVTACEEGGFPTEGFVVAHSKRRGSIQPAVIRAVTTAKQEGAHYYVFYGQHDLRTVEEWRAVLREAALQVSRET